MRTVGVAELKARLSRILNRVKAGEELVITEHGRPIARLLPLAGATRLGVLRPPEHPLDLRLILDRRRPKDPERAVLRALLEEREEGR